jgi:hypothetical protein
MGSKESTHHTSKESTNTYPSKYTPRNMGLTHIHPGMSLDTEYIIIIHIPRNMGQKRLKSLMQSTSAFREGGPHACNPGSKYTHPGTWV